MGTLSSLLVVLVSFVIAYWMRFESFAMDNSYRIVLLIGLLFSSVIFPATGAYRTEFRWDIMRRLRRLIAGWALVVIALVSSATLLKVTADYSRIWFSLWVVFCSAGLMIATLLESAWFRRFSGRNRNRKQLILVGSGEAAARVERRLTTDKNLEFEIIARFGSQWEGRLISHVSGLAEFVATNPVDDVWIATELEDKAMLEATLHALKDSVVDVHVVPDLYQYRLLNQNVTEWQGLPVISLSGTPLTGSELRLKAVFDRLGSLVLLIFSLPLILVIALVIRFSSKGPVIFKQLRHGVGGEPIYVFKFRTMKMHSESFSQAVPEDDRVTRFGALLRRTSLDEIPQFINVLKGEMSLVGPRPHPVELNDYYLSRIPKYMFRHKAKPGITGWAQVNGLRGRTETEEKMALRIEHDLWYIQNWSIWLDLQILMRTPFAMIGRNVF